MTVDERLEKLLERHEALTQTVEMIGHRVEDLTLIVTDLAKTQARLDNRIDRLYNVTLKIGADFYTRLLKLEKDSGA